jgi:18S rRNA (adenine1779-N6/adenine1780-N6)-dimethyltransferase
MVVKFVPRDPPLQVDFREWDGLMRVCFSRKRKTLSSLFKPSSVLNMLETNYKMWCSLNNKAPALVPFKDLVMQPLIDLNLKERRAITIDIETYFQLLAAYNKLGIHFVNVAKTPGEGAKDPSGSGLEEYMFYDDDDQDDGMDG